MPDPADPNKDLTLWQQKIGYHFEKSAVPFIPFYFSARRSAGFYIEIAGYP
jgi:hypothetical protein